MLLLRMLLLLRIQHRLCRLLCRLRQIRLLQLLHPLLVVRVAGRRGVKQKREVRVVPLTLLDERLEGGPVSDLELGHCAAARESVHAMRGWSGAGYTGGGALFSTAATTSGGRAGCDICIVLALATQVCGSDCEGRHTRLSALVYAGAVSMFRPSKLNLGCVSVCQSRRSLC